MPVRYKSKGLPGKATDLHSVAAAVLGTIDWQDEHTGYCACPGAHLHTGPTRERDCRVHLDAGGGFVPTLFCFHGSCADVVADINHRLRSAIGKATWRSQPRLRPQATVPEGVLSRPFETFLEACFKPDEIISIAPGTTDGADSRAYPEHAGVNVFTCREWIQKARRKGGIERLFSTRHGLYVRINPVAARSGGVDKDVTALRHTLVESDKLPKDQQEQILRDSGLPISALIDSGGSSIHAWVRVDARDREQYHERRERIWKSLPEHFQIDPQNKNPSRFSRCPGGRRGEALQRLLDVNLGPPDFETWENQADGLGLSPPLRISTLGDYDVAHDPNNVLGSRWLCRGGSLIVVGQSGIGKSSISMQMAVTWALGRPVFNIAPVKPLRSLIIQAENDVGDLAEMFQGVRQGLGLSDADLKALEQNIIIYRDTIHSGADFARTADILIRRHQPDLVWGDPLLNYIGDDASQQRVISEFCGGLLNPISERTGIIWCFMHHTGKPSQDSKARQHWTGSDYAYSGLGSSALTNWAREVAVLNRVKTPKGDPPVFRFELCKRRRRAGMKDTGGNPTETIFVRHGETGICWLQCEEPQEEEKGPPKAKSTYTIGKGRPRVIDQPIAEFDTLSELTNEHAAELSAQYGVSIATLKRRWRDHRNKHK